VLSFGSDGVVTIQFTPGAGYQNSLFSLAVQPDGKVLTVGTHLARFNSDGSLDLGFGGGGFINAGGDSVELQGDGKFFVGYSGNHSFAFAHYNTNGSLDSGFGSNGIVLTPIYGNNDGIYALAIQPGGKLVAAGSAPKVFESGGFY
jgi:uncharacterized delta-60 repeat protein